MEPIKRVLRKIKDSIVQPCPPELYACEVCGKLECTNEEWLNCEKRLRVAAQMQESADQFHCPHEGEGLQKE